VATTKIGYGIETARSREISERLARSIPGGNTRSLVYFPPYPLAISPGSGCRIRDADGNEFVDLLNNYTASVHGHAVPAVNEAMMELAAFGTVFPAPPSCRPSSPRGSSPGLRRWRKCASPTRAPRPS
jgi:glutamate-1-semialdehyde 2,1-aminomutase